MGPPRPSGDPETSNGRPQGPAVCAAWLAEKGHFLRPHLGSGDDAGLQAGAEVLSEDGFKVGPALGPQPGAVGADVAGERRAGPEPLGGTVVEDRVAGIAVPFRLELGHDAVGAAALQVVGAPEPPRR